MNAPPDPPPLRLGTLLPTREQALEGRHDPRGLIDLAVRLEAEGVDSLWIGESIVARPRLDAFTMLAALAARTDRVALGTAVVLPALRAPVAFAHQVATLDRLAQGRLLVGVGAGFPGDATRAEFESLGGDYPRRSSALRDTLAAARAIWAAGESPASDPTGRFGFHDVGITPPPLQPGGPPTWLATGTEAGLRRCALDHDGWLPYPTSPGAYASGLEQIRKQAAAAGRDPASITPALYVTVATGDPRDADERMDAYCRRYYGLPRVLVGAVQAMLAGPREAVVEAILAYVAAGARHVVIRHAGFDTDALAREAVALHADLKRRG